MSNDGDLVYRWGREPYGYSEPRDRFDIPDDREPDDNIPGAVTDANCPECDEPTLTHSPGLLPVCTTCDYTGWEPIPDAVCDVQTEAYWPPPDPDTALTFDECEDAGLDGTLRDM